MKIQVSDSFDVTTSSAVTEDDVVTSKLSDTCIFIVYVLVSQRIAIIQSSSNMRLLTNTPILSLTKCLK